VRCREIRKGSYAAAVFAGKSTVGTTGGIYVPDGGGGSVFRLYEWCAERLGRLAAVLTPRWRPPSVSSEALTLTHMADILAAKPLHAVHVA
jgi:hypothetical protein